MESVSSELKRVLRVEVAGDGGERFRFEFEIHADDGSDAVMSCSHPNWPASAANKAVMEFNAKFPEALL